MPTRMRTVALWIAAVVVAGLLAALVWRVSATGTLEIVAEIDEASRWLAGSPAQSTPPEMATIRFAETCARRIVEDNRGFKGHDASGFNYETCLDVQQTCEKLPEAQQQPCKSYCRNFKDIMEATGSVRTRDCQYNLNYVLARSMMGDSEVTNSISDDRSLNIYRSTIVIQNWSVLGLFGRRLCTGVLIAPNLALTAAHCVEDGAAVQGASVSNARDAPLQDESAVARVVDTITMRGSNRNGIDLALISLDKSFNSDSVSKLGVSSKLGQYPSVRNVGYGWNEKGEIGHRRFGDVVVASWECDEGAANIFNCQQGLEIVASRYAKSAGRPFDQARLDEMQSKQAGVFTDSCEGDSGGPVFSPVQDVLGLSQQTGKDPRNLYNAALLENSERWLVGITNEAISVQPGREPTFIPVKLDNGEVKKIACGDGTRYVNVTVPKIRNWIVKTAKDKFNVQITQ